ncbi:hypothetical protein V865_006322 [Kwoniella europaea PYCC6329]|uniref:Uncharacterized protein n=1 Tax=Kwoniella europaea PYCC6329 TaxID=1423913 RepID=A0AAX4KP47_9TREE
MTHPNGTATASNQPNGNGVIRPWAADFNTGSKSFTTLDGKPVDWNGGWAGIGGETAGPQSTPAPITSKSGQNNQEITYLPYPELTCLHCLGSNPPGKLGYVVSYLPVIPAGSSNGQQTTAAAEGQGTEDRLGELPVRPSAPSLGGSAGSFRAGRSAFRSADSASKAPRARSRAEERVDDFERGRQIEREAQEERARSSSVSWELAGVGKQYVPDGEEEDVVIE